MACCLAVAFLIGVSRTAWRWVLRRPEPLTPFPPPAFRKAPGAAAPVATAPMMEAEASRPSTPARRDPRPLTASLLFFAAVGAAVYAGGVAVIIALGGADEGAFPTVGWIARHAVVVLLAAAALVGERLLLVSGPRIAGRARAASALIGGGIAWVGFGVLDQHAFGLFEIAGGSLAWDLVFHGAGSLAIVAGWVMLPTERALRPAPAASP